jgi:hypothetical protein
MTEQENFEAWLTSGIKGKPFPKNEDGNYLHVNWQIQWMAWQAAIASRAGLEEDNRLLREQNDMLDKELAIREQKPMPIEKAEEIAYRTASRYTHKPDVSFKAYTFLSQTLEDFVRNIERLHGIGD